MYLTALPYLTIHSNLELRRKVTEGEERAKICSSGKIVLARSVHRPTPGSSPIPRSSPEPSATTLIIIRLSPICIAPVCSCRCDCSNLHIEARPSTPQLRDGEASLIKILSLSDHPGTLSSFLILALPNLSTRPCLRKRPLELTSLSMVARTFER